jgi:UDP-N-acetylglucosamine 2-epimerase (non-hydrolysing)
MEEASVMMVGLDSTRILQALQILENQPRENKKNLHIPADYATTNVSDKVVRILMSYTSYVNRVIWKNYK